MAEEEWGGDGPLAKSGLALQENSRLDLSDSVVLTQQSDTVKSIKPPLPFRLAAGPIQVWNIGIITLAGPQREMDDAEVEIAGIIFREIEL